MKKHEFIEMVKNKENQWDIQGYYFYSERKYLPVKKMEIKEYSISTMDNLINTLFGCLPNVSKFFCYVILGDIFILVDNLPREEDIEKANTEIYNILPVCASLKIEECEFDMKKFNKEQLKLQETPNDI